MTRSSSMQIRKTRVVILGGGFGGVFTARHLERLLRRNQNIEIVLVSRDNYFLMTPLLFDVCTGTLGLHNCSVPIRSALHSTRIVEATVTDVNVDRRVVTIQAGGEQQEIEYDHLVLALGGVTNQRTIPGSDAAFTFKSLADAALLRNHVLEQFERADAESDVDLRRRRLTFAFIGGGFVGVELFGELTAFVRKILRLYPRVREEELRFVLLQHGDRLMPEVDPKLATYATNVLRARPGVEIRTGTNVTRVAPGRVILGDSAIEAGTIVLAAGTSANPLIATLPLSRDKRGRLAVAATMRSPDRPEVWALGDCAAVPDPHGNPYPTLAQHAIRQAKVLARNIAAVLAEREPKPFVYDTLGIMASLGAGKGLGKVLTVHVRGLLAFWVRRGYYLMTMPGWGRRLRIVADWAVALVTRPDTGRIDLDTALVQYERGRDADSPRNPRHFAREPTRQGERMTTFQKILVPTDFSLAAAEAFRIAVSLAKSSGGEVIVAHVTRAPAVVVENGEVTPGREAGKPLNLWHKFRELVPDDSDVHVTHEVVVTGRKSSAETVRMLEEFGCDLIVIGSHGHGRLRRLLRGSLTDDIVRHARRSVLVVKAPAQSRLIHETPVAALNGKIA